MKKIFVSVSSLVFLTLSIFAQPSAVFNPSDGAIHGFDPVAYFKESKPVKGDKRYVLLWNSATWYFYNQQNLDLFKSNPEKFAPQYGGYCAYGLANGHKAPADPQAWTIAGGKLYLNYNKTVQQSWKKKQADYILSADKNWPVLKDKE
ncbi:MAG: YHS domain-containing (seleno)protein [Chitinophagaceae bacterium]